MVKGGSIVSVEYNAENPSGFIKSWDNAYMQNMLHTNGTYPNEYTRYYASQLLEDQGADSIDAINGAGEGKGRIRKIVCGKIGICESDVVRRAGMRGESFPVRRTSSPDSYRNRPPSRGNY